MNNAEETPRKIKNRDSGFALFLVEVVRWGAYTALFAPLVVSSNFLFPFVVTKTVFFWIFAEIIFAAWVLLAISNERFRPRWNALTLSFFIFIFVAIVTSFTGVNVERSFWSTLERMAGTINWIHLGLFFLAVSSTFREVKDWKKFLSVSLFASLLVALIFLLEKVGVSVVGFNTKGGSTIGNSSFMSAYLIFNVFFGIWLVSKTKNFSWRTLYVSAVFLLALTILISTAYGALLSMIGGFFLLFVAWLFFTRPIKFSRFVSVSLLAVGIMGGSIIAWATFTQNEVIVSRLPSFFSRSDTIQARKVVWEIAIEGIKERPILGWGPENFNTPFVKYFNPCLALPECGNEVWFDRTHNIILDHLANSGIVGLASYLALLASVLFMAWKRAFGTLRDWVFPTVITSILISYVVQNMLVFDMLNTYLMFAVILSFVSAMGVSKEERAVEAGGSVAPSSQGGELNSPNPFAIFAVAGLLVYFLFSFGLQSYQAAYWGLKIGRGGIGAAQTVELYKKSLSVSPMGNRQIPEFFTIQIMNTVASDNSIPSDFVDSISEIMRETVEKNPFDYRHYIILGNFYNIARARDGTYLARAEEVLIKSIEISPKNQQGYFSLTENYIYQGRNKEAVDMAKIGVSLEPGLAKAHWFLSRAYKANGDEELSRKSLQRAEELGYNR